MPRDAHARRTHRGRLMTTRVVPVMLAAALCLVLAGGRAAAQTSANTSSEESTISGTVVSSTPSTLVVRTAEGTFVLFVLDRETARPRSLPRLMQVRVTSRPGDTAEARVATAVGVVAPPPAPAAAQSHAAPQDPVPASIRRAEHSIKRQARRYRAGALVGAALDPELVSIAGHGRFGPLFSDRIYARPALEFAFGEVTKLVAINLEGIYQLPLRPQRGTWSIYAGGGPGLIFSHRSFKDETGDEIIDFGDWDFDTSFNFLVGVEFRSGLLLEFKSTAYSGPHIRFLIGYNF